MGGKIATKLAHGAKLRQSNDRCTDESVDETNALSSVLESLGHLMGSQFQSELAQVLQTFISMRVVQAAGLRALNNLMDANALSAASDYVALRSVCCEALVLHGNRDERVRSAAERAIGLLSFPG